MLCLGAACNRQPATIHEISLPLPAVELGLPHGLPLAGAETADVKAIEERASDSGFTAVLEAPGGTVEELPVRFNRGGVRVADGTVAGGKVRVEFPGSAGYQRRTISFSWWRPLRYNGGMALSARNQLQGTIEELKVGDIMAHVVVRVGDNLIESVITRASAEALGLKRGDRVRAVIKSTEVMIQKD
jgi:molybdopterin-binding protein